MNYILDYSTWRCGGDVDGHLGEGQTALLNEEGYMCCLGQFALQIEGVEEKNILNEGEPGELGKQYDPVFVKKEEVEYDDEYEYSNTELADELIKINDAHETTPRYKINEIKKALKKQGHELEVINTPW